MSLSSRPAARPEAAERSWYITGRWQEFEGEARVNLLRVVAIATYYAVELLNYHGLRLGSWEPWPGGGVDRPFHEAVTALAVAWVALSAGVAVCLRQRVFPAFLKYLATGADLIFLTGVLVLADGPRSPLVVGYFLVIAMAALRFSLPLVWFSTVGAVLGYLFLLGQARYFAGTRDLTVPRHHQLIVLLALVFNGVIVGQVVRRVRLLAADYARRLGAAGGHGA